MGASLDMISIRGFKSIRELDSFPLGKLNVLVGPNGAGKSNFVDFFRMLRAMADGRLAAFVTERGGADGFFFGGPKTTNLISVHLAFGENEYRFSLSPTVGGVLMVAEEWVLYRPSGSWQFMGMGGTESGLPTWQNAPSRWGKYRSVQSYVFDSVSSWTVYHFHDTSALAPMRREQSIHDFGKLNPDASNIAAFLRHLRNTPPTSARYSRIRETIQLIAPFFDDFLLEPQKRGNEEFVRLQWRQRGSDFPFQPWHLSDGTLRFICLATALLQPVPPSTIVIDEPELGLHPFALEMLAGLLREASDRTQVIVSTQSASLLNYFEPEEVIVADRVEGASQFRRLDSESLGAWLEDYSLGELWQKNVIDGGPSHE